MHGKYIKKKKMYKRNFSTERKHEDYKITCSLIVAVNMETFKAKTLAPIEILEFLKTALEKNS